MSDRVEITLSSASSREATIDLIRKARSWSRVTISGPLRTKPQNAKIRVMLDQIATQAKWQGRVLEPAEWKDLFTSAVLIAGAEAGDVIQGLEGGIVVLGRRTSELSVGEACDLITYLTKWAEENGVVFRDTPARPNQRIDQ
ncbi:MAG: recombination protein NinB [Brevundimonas sp.]